MNPSLIQRAEPMTLIAATAPRRPASHAFTVPVVRELAPRTNLGAVGTAW